MRKWTSALPTPGCTELVCRRLAKPVLLTCANPRLRGNAYSRLSGGSGFPWCDAASITPKQSK
eukprot:11882646-Karenia_brevis.AAC.1